MNNYGIALLVGALIVIVAKFAFRDFLCWYWKVNENLRKQDNIIELLNEQNDLLKKILKNETKNKQTN